MRVHAAQLGTDGHAVGSFSPEEQHHLKHKNEREKERTELRIPTAM
jgi:hypothetical protein